MKKIILNQKSYLLYDDEVAFKKEFDKLKNKKYSFILFPPVHYLSMFKSCNYAVGTQNFFSYQMGSFTGEVNLESLKKMDINYTLIGHFERKKIMGEPHEIIKEKVYKSLSSKCNTILCVGEQNRTIRPFSCVKKELNYYLRSIESDTLKYLSIAYTPSYAVSCADKPIEQVTKIVDGIRKYFKNRYNIDIEVYYGGNIENGNIKEIMDICDGVLLDKPSTDVKLIKELLKEL